jgi:uncharacterized Rmd1/YagE family protein
MTQSNTQPCSTICLAKSFRFSELLDKLLTNRRTQVFRNVLIVDYKNGYSIIFNYGVVVHWNIAFDERRELHQLLLEFSEQPNKEIIEDQFTYTTGCESDRIQYDHIELQADNEKLLLALSHAMAQSIKLAAFENQAQETIKATQHLPQALAQYGKIKLGAKTMAKIRGQLFLTKSNIVLHYDLLDTPEFFWEYPEYQNMYSMAANYLEIKQRTEVLSQKLETIRELLEMLADEQKHRHSSILEWIIIWLIIVEIILSLIDNHFK